MRDTVLVGTPPLLSIAIVSILWLYDLPNHHFGGDKVLCRSFECAVAYISRLHLTHIEHPYQSVVVLESRNDRTYCLLIYEQL